MSLKPKTAPTAVQPPINNVGYTYGGFEPPPFAGIIQGGIDMAKNVMNSNFAKGAKLGYKVAGEQKQPMQMEVNESEIMDPQTMALMRMGRMR